MTRKITMGLSKIDLGIQDCLYLGNLDSLRDWGHAKDYVEMQWRMLQQDKPEDYVIATGRMTSVRKFIEIASYKLNWGGIKWEGSGDSEIGRRHDNNRIVIRIDPSFYRPAEVDQLLGNASKAHTKLGWRPKISLEQLIDEMIESDKKLASKSTERP